MAFPAQQPRLLRSSTSTISNTGDGMPAASPLGSAVPATPGTILRRYGMAPGMPYPPGMGFTPAAAQLAKRTTSFGFGMDRTLSNGGIDRKVSGGLQTAPAVLAASTADSSLPVPSVAEATEAGGFSRETLLFLRESCRDPSAAALTPAEAGFALPQPGWLRTQRAEVAPALGKRQSGGNAVRTAASSSSTNASAVQAKTQPQSSQPQQQTQPRQQQWPQQQQQQSHAHQQQYSGSEAAAWQDTGGGQWSWQDQWGWQASAQKPQQQGWVANTAGGGSGNVQRKGRGKGRGSGRQ